MKGPRAGLSALQRAGLVLWGLYLLLGWAAARASLGAMELPPALRPLQTWTWPVRWRMFTDLRDQHESLLLELREGECTLRIDPERLFPNRWDEGPGYLRDDFLRDPAAVGPLAQAVCARKGAGTGASVILTLQRWPRTPGQVEQPTNDARTFPLWRVPCGGQPVPLEGLSAVQGERQGRAARKRGAP